MRVHTAAALHQANALDPNLPTSPGQSDNFAGQQQTLPVRFAVAYPR